MGDIITGKLRGVQGFHIELMHQQSTLILETYHEVEAFAMGAYGLNNYTIQVFTLPSINDELISVFSNNGFVAIDYFNKEAILVTVEKETSTGNTILDDKLAEECNEAFNDSLESLIDDEDDNEDDLDE